MSALLKRVRDDGTKLMLIDNAESWMSKLRAVGAVPGYKVFHPSKAWVGSSFMVREHPYPDGELVYHCRLYAIGFLQPKGQTATFSNLRISEDTWNTLLYNPAETYVEKGEGKLNVWYPG